MLARQQMRRQHVAVVVVDVRDHDGAAGETLELLVDGIDPAQRRRVAVERHAAGDVGDPAERSEEVVGVRVELPDPGVQPGEHVPRDGADLLAMHLVGVDEEHPVGRSLERFQRLVRVVAHGGEVDERPPDHPQPAVASEGTRLDGADRLAPGHAGIVVDGQDVDDVRDRIERGGEERLGGVSDAQRTGNHAD